MVVPLSFFFFKQKTAYEIGLGIPAEPLFRSCVYAQETLTFSSASVRTSVFPARTRKVNANNSAALTGRSTPLIMFSEIGRASCRERVEISVVAGSLKKKSAERRA